MRDNDGNDQDTMTLRDRFAMAALQGLASNTEAKRNPEAAVQCAYRLAYAMLEERANHNVPVRADEGSVREYYADIAAAGIAAAEKERADVLTWLLRQEDNTTNGGERAAYRNVISALESGVHVGAIAKAGAK